MPFFPKLVGDIQIQTRQPRYRGEPTHKRCSFVRSVEKPQVEESWEIIRPVTASSSSYRRFPEHEWHRLSHEQQRAILEQYNTFGARSEFRPRQQVISPSSGRRFHGEIPPPPPMAPLPASRNVQLIEPQYELLEPSSPHKKSLSGSKKSKKVKKVDKGYAIFDSDSDDARSISTLTTISSSRSKKSSRSGSGSSSGSRRSTKSTVVPVVAW